jgi:manganese/zinc/iron transport system ATP- binding protein
MNEICYAVEVEDLTVAYDTKPVLWDVDLKIPQGKLTAIIGPNGAGKTTLIKAMLHLLKPVSGSIAFPTAGSLDKKATKNRIAYVPQSGSVDWDFPATVLDVAMMGRYGLLGWLKGPKKRDRDITMSMLGKVGMVEYANRQISQLSGGQQQRVFLARALVQEAEIYFLDEPFKGVDVQTEKAIIGLLKDLREQGKTVIVVHHDLHTVPDYFDWVTLINMQVVASGPVEQVFSEENLSHAYRSTVKLLGEAV